MIDAIQSNQFCKTYGLRYSYVSGSMYRGISSVPLVIAMSKAHLLSFFGSAGLSLDHVEKAILAIKAELSNHNLFGMNLLFDLNDREHEINLVECYLQHRIRVVEASAYMKITPGLVQYRLSGLTQLTDGRIQAAHHIMAKVSRLEIAHLFMQPAPQHIVADLLGSGKISSEEARLSQHIPLAHDITVEADSAGHTDGGSLLVLLPAFKQLAKRYTCDYDYSNPIRLGAAGGLGTPSAIAAAYMLGADYVLTGSINQCTVESGASAAVKELLQTAGIHDMAYAPAGDMFELGSKIQVFKRGLLFPVRANKLYELYKQHDSLDDLDPKTQDILQNTYFGRSFSTVWDEVVAYFSTLDPHTLERARQSSKQKMALIFRWYFAYSNRIAIAGMLEDKVNFQIHCGPALGAFNAWAKNTPLDLWQNRHVAEIAQKLMMEAKDILSGPIAYPI